MAFAALVATVVATEVAAEVAAEVMAEAPATEEAPAAEVAAVVAAEVSAAVRIVDERDFVAGFGAATKGGATTKEEADFLFSMSEAFLFFFLCFTY